MSIHLMLDHISIGHIIIRRYQDNHNRHLHTSKSFQCYPSNNRFLRPSTREYWKLKEFPESHKCHLDSLTDFHSSMSRDYLSHHTSTLPWQKCYSRLQNLERLQISKSSHHDLSTKRPHT